MIKTLSLLVCLTGLLLSGLLGPQAIAQDWRVHTPFRSVTDLAASNEAVWTATSGGVFSFAPASGEISRYTTSQGLSSVDAAAIAVSAAGRVWIGYRDGVLDALDPASEAVNSFLDIARADQFADRGINRLRIFGDTLMAGTEFGLVLFDTERGEVRDALTVFGSVPPATPVRDVLIAPGPAGPTLWVATAAGLAHAPLSSVNLREPTEWTVETLAAGEAANDVFALAFFEGRIVAGTATDAFVQQADGTWQPSGISGNGVLDFVEQAGRLYATKAFSLGSLDSPAAGTPAGRIDVTLSVNTQTVPYDRPLRLVEGPDGALWLGDRVEGLLRLPDAPAGDVTGEQAVVPEGPFFSLFSDLVFDANGLLWVAGAPGPGTGFYAFDGAEWTTYAGRFEPALLGRDGFASIHVGPDGNVWAGSQGEGLAQVTPEGEVVTYDPQNSSLLPAGNATDFVIVRGIASDADGTLYVSNEITPRPMAIRSPDGTWTSLPAIRGDGIPASLDRYDQIYVDTFGQKWLLPVPSTGTGLIVWDTAGTPTDRTDDRVKYLRGQGSNGQGLPNPGVRAWA
ncbi:MAG: regulator, partial [Bacteroidota bacterium]